MILDNEYKTSVIQNSTPTINVAEAIHGTYNTNFVLDNNHNSSKGALPLGLINDSVKVTKKFSLAKEKPRIFREQSRNSIQYLTADEKLDKTLQSNYSKQMLQASGGAQSF